MMLRGTNGCRDEIAPSWVRVEVDIVGWLSVTSVTMRFMSNEAPHGESVAKDEFELIFALPENSTVCGYAADIEGKMVEANVIEKQVARAALETSIRANKGASLAEKTSGNLFRVRIFPVLPGIARVIKVAFSKTLGCDGVYNFPLKSCADSTSIKINVFSLSPNSPLVTLGAERYSMTQQSESNATQYEFSFSTDLHSVNTTICIHTGLELIDQATIPAFTERGDEAIDDNDFTFFYAPLVLNSTNIPQSMSPSVVVVLWDTSQSRLECNKSREVEALLFLLKNLNPSFIDVVCFSNQVTSYERFSGSDRVTTTMNFITNLSYDGGTNLSAAVNWAAKSFSAINGVIGLLFSDGLTSWGEEYKTVEMLNIPFFTFTASVRADFLVLQRIASGTGGLFFNLQENKDVSAVLATRVYYMRATDVTGRIVSDVYPSTPQPVGTPFWISGKIITPIHEDIITIHFCVPSTNISFTKAVSVSRNTVTTAPMGIVSRFWAQMLVNEKASFGNPSHSKENIISLARKYKFVTDDTSFMLLDSLDQYLEHGIEPADSLPEIKKEYEVKIALREAEKARDLVQYSQYVAKMWRRRVSWWEAHYDGCTRNCLDLNFLSLEAAQYQVNDNNRPLEPDFIPPTPEPAPKPAVEAPRAASGTFGLFGRRKLHPPPEPSELIKNLREASEAIEKRGYQLEKRIKTEKEKALAFHRAKNKRACMFSLKQAKLLSSQMESLFTRQTAIEQTLLTLESATTNLECMKIGAAALGQAPSVTLSVEDSMDSIRDQLDSCEEISDAISQPISEIFDEEELEQELEELVFAESGQETIMKTIACTPQSSGVQLNRSEDDELAELERMMMGDYSPSLPTNTSEEILHQNGSESVTQEFCQATQYPAPDPVQSCGHFSLEAPVQPFSSRPEGDEKYDFSLPSVHDRGREVSESDVEKSGWCTKQGGSLKSWKRRFYVLKGNNLLYFKSPTEKEPVACIKLDPRMEITKEERHTRHVLTIKIPRRSYIMNLDSKEEIDSWVDCLQRKLATLGPALQILPIPQGQRILPMINNSERFFLSLPDVTVLQEYGHVLKRHSNILNSLRTIIESNSVLCLNPAFFIQVALCLFEHGGMSLLFLSNMTESNPENSRAIRSASFLLMQAGLIDEAIYLLEKCLKLRQEEPQSHRDLALALMQTGKPGDLERALSLMHHVITQRWDTRFAQIQVVALMEFNSMLTRSDTPSTTSVDPDPRIISPIDVDIRCVMQWDTDMTDVELIVIEPNGEKCFSFNNLSKCGALVSKNFSRGYGPTEYIIKKAVPGTYKIFARLYHTPDPSIIVTTCVSVTVDFGRTTEQLVGYCVAPVSHKTPEVLVGTIDCTN